MSITTNIGQTLFGHEFGELIVEVGREVRKWQVSEWVAVDPNLYCGRCDFCRNEQANRCDNWQGVGITRPGDVAEYTAVLVQACYRGPSSLQRTKVSDRAI